LKGQNRRLQHGRGSTNRDKRRENRVEHVIGGQKYFLKKKNVAFISRSESPILLRERNAGPEK